MSDNELEIVFESVATGCETRTVQNSSETDVMCLSRVSRTYDIPKISVEKAQKIKSDTSEYLKHRIKKIKTKTKSQDVSKLIRRQEEVDHPTLKLKSVKYAPRNEMGKKKLHLCSVKDGIHVPSRILKEEKADSTISEATAVKASPVNPQNTLEDVDTLIDSFAKIISEQCPESSSSLITQFSVSPRHLVKNNSEFRDSSLKSPAEGPQLNYSKEKLHSSGKPQCSQKNKIIVTTDLKEGSKGSETSPELLQWVQKNKSTLPSISSTSELSEVVEVCNSKQNDPETPQCSSKNNIIVNSCSSSTDLSEGSKDCRTSSPELLQWVQKIKSKVHSTSSTSESSKVVEVHNSKHDSVTPQYSQNNKMIVNSCLSSTVTSEGSKDSKTFEFVQKNKSIVHSASPSTSERNECAKVQSGGSPSSNQPQIKLSYQLSKRPNKFSINGSPASSPKNRNFYSSLNKSPKSGHQSSLSPMNNKYPVNHASDARGVKRKLNFSNSSSEISSTVENNKIPWGDEAEPVQFALLKRVVTSKAQQSASPRESLKTREANGQRTY